MKIRNRDFLEIIGIFGVIASLVFVGMQLMLDRRVAMGSQFHERSELYHQALQSVFENNTHTEELAEWWEKGGTPSWWTPDIESFRQDREWSMELMVRQYYLTRMRMLRFNDNYFQYKSGLVSEDTWQTNRRALKNTLRGPYNQMIALNFGVYESKFNELIQDIMNEIESEN